MRFRIERRNEQQAERVSSGQSDRWFLTSASRPFDHLFLDLPGQMSPGSITERDCRYSGLRRHSGCLSGMSIDTSNCIFASVSIFSADQVALFSRNETSSNELEKGLRGIIFYEY